MNDALPRVFREPLLGAVIALAVLCSSLWTAVGQYRAGHLIDAAPVRVDAVVTDVQNLRGGPEYTVQYQVDGRTYSTESLELQRLGLPAVGDHIRLEVAASAPGTARLLGDRYPEPDMPTTEALTAVGATAALVICLYFHVQRRRARADGTG
ncbi:hypothetical protein ABT095_17705 [Kitasatospora sp. NPDC002227]|uniref:hypothetical protein n=1 Tax=Kitasatospora sp. NPDC002227 TaxID=3154773 RepID=UPI00331AD5B8